MKTHKNKLYNVTNKRFKLIFLVISFAFIGFYSFNASQAEIKESSGIVIIPKSDPNKYSVKAAWHKIYPPFKIGTCYLASIDEILFLGTKQYGIYYSTDYGLNWKESNNGLPYKYLHEYGEVSNYYEIESLVTINKNIYAGTLSDGIFISTNKGKEWFAMKGGKNSIRSIAMLDKNIFIAGGSQKEGIEGIYRSTNNGLTWNESNNGIPRNGLSSSQYDVTSLAVSKSYIFAATSHNGIYQSSDYGDNWIAVKTSLNNLHINTLAVLNNFLLFAGTNEGIFISTEWQDSIHYGEKWIKIESPIKVNDNIIALTFCEQKIFAVSSSEIRGVEIWYESTIHFSKELLQSINLDVRELK